MLKSINAGVAFLLELCMLVMLGIWGFQASSENVVRVILGIGAPLLAIILWGMFLAPRSNRRLTGIPYIILKFIIFGVATIAFMAAGQVTLAIIFIVVAVINQFLAIVWKQEAVQSTT